MEGPTTTTEVTVSIDIDDLLAVLGDIYADYRTALLNSKYNAYELVVFKRLNSAYEAAVAVGSSTSIAAWSIFNAPGGKILWGIISGASVLLTTLKPVLKLPNRIEQYSKLYVAYLKLFLDLKQIVSDIKIHGGLSREILKSFATAQEQNRNLALQDDPRPRKKLLRRLQEEVNREIPPDTLWNPKARRTKQGGK